MKPMMGKEYIEIKNNSMPVDISKLPVHGYEKFSSLVSDLLSNESNHCTTYFPVSEKGRERFIICIADDSNKVIRVFSHITEDNQNSLKSLSKEFPRLHVFEREIHENRGIVFEGHPWLKPVRFPHSRPDKTVTIEGYPFYEIDSEELHEVGVGPVHAGVIEPGHFRFICNGEKVLHLEIQLGYQHRGVETLFIEKEAPLQRSILSENIAGDTVIGHALAHVQLIESLAGIDVSKKLQVERCIALELERIAVHIGDTAALCGDVAYQFGQAVCEALRTTIINTTQFWCGNRFGKGLIRPGGTNFPLNAKTVEEIVKVLPISIPRYEEVADRIFSLPSLLARFEDIGIVAKKQALEIGAVGMAARSSGLMRDIRITHPFQYFRHYEINPVVHQTGDVLARALQRKDEITESARIIRNLIDVWKDLDGDISKPDYNFNLKPDSFAISLTEGWRGEICHTAITGKDGEIVHYKVKDPSFHNWMALALAVRNQEISDFPLCNKSYNLSYCGHDL